jgi:hypothetical protein
MNFDLLPPHLRTLAEEAFKAGQEHMRNRMLIGLMEAREMQAAARVVDTPVVDLENYVEAQDELERRMKAQ